MTEMLSRLRRKVLCRQQLCPEIFWTVSLMSDMFSSAHPLPLSLHLLHLLCNSEETHCNAIKNKQHHLKNGQYKGSGIQMIVRCQ